MKTKALIVSPVKDSPYADEMKKQYNNRQIDKAGLQDAR
jgi:hypothetical protein